MALLKRLLSKCLIPKQAIPSETHILRTDEGNAVQNGLEVVLVHKNQDVDQVVGDVHQNKFKGKNNITNVV